MKKIQVRAMKLLSIAAIMLATGPILAGARLGYPVAITYENNNYRVMGSLGSTRNSADLNEHINCVYYAWADFLGAGTFASCYARPAGASRGIYCVSRDKAFTDGVRAISGDTVLAYVIDQTGTCKQLTVINDSSAEPKVK